MIKYEFTDGMTAHGFHAEALQYGPARMEYVCGWHPAVWFVWVSPEFDGIVEARRAPQGDAA